MWVWTGWQRRRPHQGVTSMFEASSRPILEQNVWKNKMVTSDSRSHPGEESRAGPEARGEEVDAVKWGVCPHPSEKEGHAA